MTFSNFTKIGTVTKISKGKYLTHAYIISTEQNCKKLKLVRVLTSPIKTGLKYNLLTKSTCVSTQCGKQLQIINKPAHKIPVGKLVTPKASL